MLRAVAQKSAAGALKYYTEGLVREDYYSEKQELVGKWYGKAAKALGLSGDVTKEAFAALVANRHPETGERLTMRMKGERVVGHDWNFHAPKSLSILQALTDDKDIVRVFREAVAETMKEVEALTETRVRKKGAQANRVTGNLSWAEFVHFTARPVGGIPDPHLHVHCFVFNATHDDVEGRWKAVKFRNIKKEAPYFEAVFHSRLAGKLAELGFKINRTAKGWEIAGIPRSLIEKFSRRTGQIERTAALRGITDPKLKNLLGAATREGKRSGLTKADLKEAWNAWLTPEEGRSISKAAIRESRQTKTPKITPDRAFADACEKLFAKASVTEVRNLIAETLRYGYGEISPEDAWKAFERREMIVREEKGEWRCTTPEVLGEELALIHRVREGRDRLAPIKPGPVEFMNQSLSEEGRAAVRHALQCPDQVIGIQGVAGAGKTTLMKEVAAQIEAAGGKIFAFAPSASASRKTQRDEGFANAETVAHLLNNTKLQKEIRGKVVWLDEAGLVGIQDMLEVLRIAGSSTKIILTGDTAQHAPVPRGDTFRLMQEYAGLRTASVKEIRRQEVEAYRKAIAALSKGDLRTGFIHLSKLGAIVEMEDETERYGLLAADFVDLTKRGSMPLVVSPTHAEGAKATAAIREALRAAGQLGREQSFTRYHDLRWEIPDRKRAENFREGLVVQFHQNAKGIKRGEMFRVTRITEKGAVCAAGGDGREVQLPLHQPSRFQVFEERDIPFASGDRIRITRNGKSDDGRRLNNGDVFTIEKISANGLITLSTGATLRPNHGHFTHGFVETSHSSQSKTVRHVLVAQSAESFSAGSMQQAYVSYSRGKESIRIFTDSRRELQAAVGKSSLRKSGLELAGITKEDINRSDGKMNGKQWQDWIKSRRVEGESRTHVKNLLTERKQDGLVKPAGMSFEHYIKMRRGLAGADGKSRSKGHPNLTPKQRLVTQLNKRSFLRPTQPKTPQAEKPKLTPREQRTATAIKSAKNHFKKVMEKAKTGVKKIGKGLKQLGTQTIEQLAKKKARRKKAPSQTEGKKLTKQKTQTQKPATPVRRK